jgi:uncharacterized membrane protein
VVTDAPNDAQTDLAPHIEQTVQAIARLHRAHDERATPMERLVDRLTRLVSRPAFIGVIGFTVVGWIAVNLGLRQYTGWSLDSPAFPWLQGAGELVAIVITTLILTSQRRKDELSELREQLTLELATMTEQKVAKLIALMEELRRDSPQLVNRIDTEAEQMSAPADPETVAEAIKDKVGGATSSTEVGRER